jgi:hypothetical protein
MEPKPGYSGQCRHSSGLNVWSTQRAPTNQKDLYLGSESHIKCFASVVFMAESRIRLYVKGVKTLSGQTDKIGFGHGQLELGDYPQPHGFQIGRPNAIYSLVLPEDQQDMVELVKKVASKHGLEVDVVDVGRENVLHRAVQGEIERLKVLPTLVANSGRKVEGHMAEQQVEELLSGTHPSDVYQRDKRTMGLG